MGAEAGRGQVDRYWHTLLGICARDIRPPSSLLPTELRAKITEILELWELLA